MCGLRRRDLREVGANLRSAEPIRAGDHGGDALPDVVLRRRIADEVLLVVAHQRVDQTGRHRGVPGVAVRVDIDEARGDDEPSRIDDASPGRLKMRCDGGDGVSLDAHIRKDPGVAGAIDDAASADHQVEGRRL